MISVIPLDTPGLGDRSYLAHDGSVALVVDPQRDFDRVLALAEEAQVRITHVFETHIHNDYVSGGLALAQHVDATYLVNADDEVEFDRVGLRDGEVVEVGPTMRVRAVHTPGHTHTHLSYVLEAEGVHHGAFTGGSLLFSSTGRPDLLGPAHTDTLVHDQWRSAQRLAAELPGQTPVFPTHGFGSFCSATQSNVDESTIGRERQENPALTQSEQEYVDTLLGGLDEFPAYYAHMAPANSAGPSAPDLTPPSVADSGELRRRMEAGEWLVDLRHREAFAAGHLPGTLNFGLDGQFVTYLGWLIPWGTPVTLLGETAEQVAQAQREMSRIGLDHPAAMATGGPRDWQSGPASQLGSFPRADFADLQTALDRGENITVLDVRRAAEFDASHIEDAVNVPIHHVLAHLDDIPRGPLWVHCAGGYRASVVASILDAHGFDVVAVDESFDQAEPAGLPLVAAA
ncbi:MAG TPA: MBL fold metallo-hydrolase [Ornithinimicrobium sp.]|uniref:MBL fold metallo-hydrolase n=1 Tax=Ornithinimicrobium sp. TaxID=1977084 RepID=UPI002B498937|nr:MBL fold metallo-hydrolase [Ornithinimicrobium sp.]HKJ12412.1 MBL fold metallo-hydrolase [Ornithinimicrobium sp.]